MMSDRPSGAGVPGRLALCDANAGRQEQRRSSRPLVLRPAGLVARAPAGGLARVRLGRGVAALLVLLGVGRLALRLVRVPFGAGLGRAVEVGVPAPALQDEPGAAGDLALGGVLFALRTGLERIFTDTLFGFPLVSARGA